MINAFLVPTLRIKIDESKDLDNMLKFTKSLRCEKCGAYTEINKNIRKMSDEELNVFTDGSLDL